MFELVIGALVLLACFACGCWGWARGYALGRRHGEATTLRRLSEALGREVVGAAGPSAAPEV